MRAILRAGEITEVVGRLSSGRTSLLLTCLRDVTRGGGLAALVDADHAFDPGSAARAGIDLTRLLWVRCEGRRDVALRAIDLLARCRGFGLIALDTGETPPPLPPSGAYRLKFAIRRTGVPLLVVGRRRLVGSCATLALESERCAIDWTGPAGIPTRLARIRTRLTWVRGPRGDAATCEWLA
jgi:hypothetical protein